jgi:low temperature requirement protein LtrA
MTSPIALHTPRIQAVMRGRPDVTPLELFFDLVFVVALTQCTALMAAEPSWRGIAKGLLVLGVLWWTWVGYTWLASMVDPEEGVVRLAMFGTMIGVLVVALCVPEAFDEAALPLAAAYAVVRFGHIALLLIASRDDPQLRRSAIGLLSSTFLGVGLISCAAFADGALQGALWATALTLDVGGPYVFGSEGWTLTPAHFSERHGLIIIIALGESILSIAVGAEGLELDAGLFVASALGVVVAAALWWLYFDIVALVAERRLSRVPAGRERNELARDTYSYLHFPMVAGIVLLALGLKKTLEHVEDPLDTVPAAATLWGVAIYLLAHIALSRRGIRRISYERLACAAILVALLPLATMVPALATLAIVALLLTALLVFETLHFAQLRERMRHELALE